MEERGVGIKIFSLNMAFFIFFCIFADANNK